MGFTQSASAQCIYTSVSNDLIILVVYVDDILIAANCQGKIYQVKADIGRKFQVKDLSELHYFLGVNVKRSSDTGNIWIGQKAYTEAVLRKFGMENSKYTSTPVTPGVKLIKAITVRHC